MNIKFQRLNGLRLFWEDYDTRCLKSNLEGINDYRYRSAAYRNIFPEVIALINSGRLSVEKLITSVISLEEIVEKGFEALVKDPSEVKILVDMNR
ncbi:MAG TPA: hypothetical protein VLZ83_13635 [Edaphocola sp.]|nr:hypothetical protein [Edaphocola sp.]